MDETLILAIISIITMGTIALYNKYRDSGDSREAFREGARIAVRNTISNPTLATRIEERLQYLPAPMLDALNRIADVADPFTDATPDDLDDDAKQFWKNMTDSDLTTGAVG